MNQSIRFLPGDEVVDTIEEGANILVVVDVDKNGFANCYDPNTSALYRIKTKDLEHV